MNKKNFNQKKESINKDKKVYKKIKTIRGKQDFNIYNMLEGIIVN